VYLKSFLIVGNIFVCEIMEAIIKLLVIFLSIKCSKGFTRIQFKPSVLRAGFVCLMCASELKPHTEEVPKRPDVNNKEKMERAVTAAVAIPLIATPMSLEVHGANAIPLIKPSLGSLPGEAYVELGDTYTCRVLNGMWQVSGAHGYDPEKPAVLSEMARCADGGFTTFDLADIYGPAEDFAGSFVKGKYASSMSKDCQFFTKWVPKPHKITKGLVNDAIGRSLQRMKTERLDLVQFHWWDYDDLNYFNAMDGLMTLKENGQIRNIGLTNFDTEHMIKLMDEGAPLVSNQVAFSIIDSRPLQKLVPECLKRNVKLLCYATLMGGFLSNRWLGKEEPNFNNLQNLSLRKYLPWIRYWGGWGLFQELLVVLDDIAAKHRVSLSNIAVRWVLDQPAVGGAIVGVRLGLTQHVEDNKRIFSFKLDTDDMARIESVRNRGRDLMDIFNDCGGEYRRRA
jgi:aryl-alcohol dehydrogenase-like predicted oxidoreductase